MNLLSPCNPHATTEARNLYSFIQACQRPLVAQHDYLAWETRYFDKVSQKFGKSPAIWGSDFSTFVTPTKPITPTSKKIWTDEDLTAARLRLIERCEKMHRAGIIVTLMWHEPYPTFGNEGIRENIWDFGKMPKSEWLAVLTPGTDAHAAWQKQMDDIATYLRILQNKKIPVLWRPYHEMNGIWFWWGNRPGQQEGLPHLWRMSYEYLTFHHELNNLLWVWSPNSPRETPGDEAYSYELFYPGADCVDILGSDIYHNDYKQSHHDDLLALAAGKPIALTEVGQLPSPEILATQTSWKWIMAWADLLFSENTEEAIRTTYAHCTMRPQNS